MNNKTFVDRIKDYFGYLESDYGFKVNLETNSPIRPMTDGLVKFTSNTTVIMVDSELGQAAVRFIRVQDSERYYLDPVSIHEYLTTDQSEKQILLSKNPADQTAALTIFNKHFLLHHPEWKNDLDDTSKKLDIQLKNYAAWIKKHASLCLLGDFSNWPDFYEYKIKRLIANEIRQGGPEFVKAIIKDENGKPKMIERPIFQKEQEHLVRLRNEVT